jgi:hypothetical protein
LDARLFEKEFLDTTIVSVSLDPSNVLTAVSG